MTPPIRSEPSWLTALSPAQRRAVEDPSRRVLVLAGAGSGKTRVLVARLAWHLLREGLPPSSILAFSFTRKACTELETRLGSLWEAHAPRAPSRLPPIAQTFHRFAWRLIRSQASALGLKSPTLVAEDPAALLRHFQQFLLDCPHLPRPEGSAGTLLGRLRPGARALVDPNVTHLHAPFQSWKLTQGLLELDDLVPLALSLLRTSAGETLRAGIQAVLVDEYQDIDPLQQQLVEALLTDQTHLSFYGDDDQAIYRWRGSEPSLIRGVHAQPTFTTHLLTVNYRCKEPILRVAAAVVAGDKARVGKEAIAHRKGGSQPQGLEALHQPARVERLIRTLLEQHRPEDIAILVRDHRDEAAIRRALKEGHLPLAHALDTPGLRVLTCHGAKGLEFPVVILPFMDREHFPNFKRLARDEQSLTRRLEQARLAKKDVRRLTPSRWQHWVWSWLERLPIPALHHVLQRQQQERTQRRLKAQTRAAWIPVLEDALARWPAEREAALAEERRLCYVAMTRAQDALYLVCQQRQACSIFLAELPEGLVAWEETLPEPGSA